MLTMCFLEKQEQKSKTTFARYQTDEELTPDSKFMNHSKKNKKQYTIH